MTELFDMKEKANMNDRYNRKYYVRANKWQSVIEVLMTNFAAKSFGYRHMSRNHWLIRINHTLLYLSPTITCKVQQYDIDILARKSNELDIFVIETLRVRINWKKFTEVPNVHTNIEVI